MKKFFAWLLIGISILLLILLFLFKNNLNDAASTMINAQLNENEKQNVSTLIDSIYNYKNNAQTYQLTFLEFGSSGCSACKRMEKVMEDIRGQYSEKVNVVFYNITFPENRKLMNYYGVSVIPTQILLDNEGEEFFRHTGYISTTKLIKKIHEN